MSGLKDTRLHSGHGASILTRLDPGTFYFSSILNKKKEGSGKKARLKGSSSFIKENGFRPYPKEAREVMGIKVAFLDDKAWPRWDNLQKRGLSPLFGPKNRRKSLKKHIIGVGEALNP